MGKGKLLRFLPLYYLFIGFSIISCIIPPPMVSMDMVINMCINLLK